MKYVYLALALIWAVLLAALFAGVAGLVLLVGFGYIVEAVHRAW
jgi:hypothetical protein